MPDTTMTTEDMLQAQSDIIGFAQPAKDGLPRRCKHGQTTNQRCDECYTHHCRWYQLEIPDKTTTTLARYVLTDDGPLQRIENLSRTKTAWMPGYLEVVDFRPIWGTWRQHFARSVETMDIDHFQQRGVTVDSFDQDQLMEFWARDITPANAAITLLSR